MRRRAVRHVPVRIARIGHRLIRRRREGVHTGRQVPRQIKRPAQPAAGCGERSGHSEDDSGAHKVAANTLEMLALSMLQTALTVGQGERAVPVCRAHRSGGAGPLAHRGRAGAARAWVHSDTDRGPVFCVNWPTCLRIPLRPVPHAVVNPLGPCGESVHQGPCAESCRRNGLTCYPPEDPSEF